MENSAYASPRRPGRRIRDSHLGQAWTVLGLALIFGAVLAAVQVNLSDVIATNKLNETLAQVPELVWGQAGAARAAADPSLEITPETLAVEGQAKNALYPVYRVARNGKPAGWVVKGEGQGYADKIELLIGLVPDASAITGIFVLDQKETPGLGSKIALPAWRSQFVGKSTASPLTVQKGTDRRPGGIDAITGATISSRSAVQVVNRTVADVQERLRAEATHLSERSSP